MTSGVNFQLKPVYDWTIEDVSDWARRLSKDKHLKTDLAKVLRKQNFTGEGLLELDQNLLKKAGVKVIGDLAVVYKSIKELQHETISRMSSTAVESHGMQGMAGSMQGMTGMQPGMQPGMPHPGVTHGPGISGPMGMGGGMGGVSGAVGRVGDAIHHALPAGMGGSPTTGGGMDQSGQVPTGQMQQPTGTSQAGTSM